MARTNSDVVKGILLDDYGPRTDGTLPDLTPFIETATVMVDRVETCASESDITLTPAELELIERWLAAHFYAVSDKPLGSKSTDGGSGSFHGQTQMGLDFTGYGQMAKRIDYSGCLASIGENTLNTQNKARAFWLGKPLSTQRTYDQRN